MTTIHQLLDNARSEAQKLHKKIDADAAKDHVALRADVKESGTKADEIAASLKALVSEQHTDVKKRIDTAAVQLQEAAKHARDAAVATDEKLKEHNRAMLGKVQDAAASLSEAVASERAKMAAK